jgi:crotonobetainyl-CoA:carnitine CoA-transferase CaiB-like acyl-CoA transferase
MVIAVGNDAQWRRLCEALELGALASDARLAANPGRVSARAEVTGAIAARLTSGTRAHWLERLRAAHVPAGPVRDLHEAVRDPALRERGMVHGAPPAGGEVSSELFALPWLADGVRAPLRLKPPALGAHTSEFLARFG